MLAVAAAIKLDSRGPVLFRQKRYGFNNELIEVFKFRSMYADRCDANATKLVTKDDPRVTRVGRFIRKTSLDELPQLFNVMLGDLSLVGPAPARPRRPRPPTDLYDEVVDGYFARHKVKPGITGWAQINGWRGETDTPEKIQKRVEHDLYYIENWSRVARPLHPAQDAVRAAEARKRLLSGERRSRGSMPAAAIALRSLDARRRNSGASSLWLALAAVALTIATSGIVFTEPAPVDAPDDRPDRAAAGRRPRAVQSRLCWPMARCGWWPAPAPCSPRPSPSTRSRR